jgi:hypothetical protein
MSLYLAWQAGYCVLVHGVLRSKFERERTLMHTQRFFTYDSEWGLSARIERAARSFGVFGPDEGWNDGTLKTLALFCAAQARCTFAHAARVSGMARLRGATHGEGLHGLVGQQTCASAPVQAATSIVVFTASHATGRTERAAAPCSMRRCSCAAQLLYTLATLLPGLLALQSRSAHAALVIAMTLVSVHNARGRKPYDGTPPKPPAKVS